MRGISWQNLVTHHTLILDSVSGRHKFIGKNEKGDKFYLVDGFDYNLRVSRKLTLDEVNELIENDKSEEA